jgi:hypothetical protein
VNGTNVPGRFGHDFVAEHQRRYGQRSPEQRRLTYDIAVDDEHADWRQWLDDQFALLPTWAADGLARRIWQDQHFWPVNLDLAAGAGLRSAGLRVAYEQSWDGLTPDWTVLSDDDKPLAFVEVHTDQPRANTFGQMRAWHGLVQRIRAIPIPVVLQVASDGGPVPPPAAGTAKSIVRDLHEQLVTLPWSTVIVTNGYRFHVMGDYRRGGQQMLSPHGMHASFIPPSSIAGPVLAQSMMEHVKEKVHTYERLAEAYDVPLVVAIGAYRFTGVQLQLLMTY